MEATQTSADVPQETAQVTEEPAKETPTPKKYKLKIYDNEEEYSEEDVLKMAQKTRAADFKFQKAAELDKARAAWLEAAKKDPWVIFKELGVDPDELAESRLKEKLRLQLMSPEQKEAYEAKMERDALKKRLEETEAKTKEEKEALDKEKVDRLKSEYAQQLDHTVPEVFKERGIAPTPRRIARAAEYLIAHAETHGKVPDFKQAIDFSEKELEKDFQDFLPKMTVEQLLKVLPRNLRDGLRKYDLDELKQQNPLRTKETKAQTPPKSVPRRARMSSDEWFDNLTKKYS
jgi:hypothetical protein